MSVYITVRTASGVEEFTVARPEDHSIQVIEGVLRLALADPHEVRLWALGEWRSTHSRVIESEPGEVSARDRSPRHRR